MKNIFSTKKFDDVLIAFIFFLSTFTSSFVAALFAYNLVISTKSFWFYIFFILFFILGFQLFITVISFVFGRFNYFYELQIKFFERIILFFKKEKNVSIYKKEKVVELKKIINVKKKRRN